LSSDNTVTRLSWSSSD